MATNQELLDFQKKQEALKKLQQQRAAGDLSITGAGAQKAVDTGIIPMPAKQKAIADIASGITTGTYAGGVQAEAQRRYDAQQVAQNTPAPVAAPVQPDTIVIRNGKPVGVRNGQDYDPYAGMTDAARIIKQREDIQTYGTKEDRDRFEAEQLGVGYVAPRDQTVNAVQRLSENVNASKQQAEIRRKQEEATRLQQQEAVNRNKSAAETEFLGGREGVQANTGMGAGIARGVTRQLDDITRQAESFRIAEEESMKQLEYYQQTNNTKLAEAESERLASIRTSLADAETKRIAADSKTRAEVLNVISTISAMPAEALAAMGASGITSLASSLGAQIDPIFASGITASAKAIMEDKALTSEQKQVQIDQLKQNMTKSLQTEAQKAVEFVTGIQSAATSGVITQEQANNILAKQGYVDKEEQEKTITVGDEVYSYNPKTNEATKIIGRGISVNIGGFKSGEGMRTDRHNNPTAFTTDIAKQAGLKEGIDYVIGDSFPGNENMKTAKLLGDPIETTIKVIDKIGFQTAKGQPRWTHTNYSKDQWGKMTHEEKVGVVGSMYQKEGGNGSLIGLYAKNDNQDEKNADLTIIAAGAASPTMIEQAKQRALDGGYTPEFIQAIEQSKNKPLSGEATKLKEIGDSGLRQIKELRSLITKPTGGFDKSKITQGVLGIDRSVKFVIDDLSDQIGRLRSGGAITADEESRFMRLLPGIADTVFGNDYDIERKLKEIELKFGGVSGSLNKAQQSNFDPLELGVNNDPMGLFTNK